MSMLVNDLLQGYAPRQDQDARILGLALDSRQLGKDYAFVALQGINAHGIEYAKEAVANGASTIIYEDVPGLNLDESVPAMLFPVQNLGKKISKIAARFYQNPGAELNVIAITGTNGKSSIAYGLANILNKLGRKTAVVGTVGFNTGAHMVSATHTTPDAIKLQKLVKQALDNKAQCLVMEASSHGLAQYRLDGVEVDIAIFTNLSRDHQDYHPNMQHYADSKERLFKLPTVESALININDDFGLELYERYKHKLRVISYGIDINPATSKEYLSAVDIKLNPQGLGFKLISSWGEAKINTPHLGRFNVENLLAVIGALLLTGFKLEQIVNKLESLELVAGRMQSFKQPGWPLVVVDFAHTPDALTKALKALREHMGPKAHIYCVFGCGGERDQGKRPLMGQAVEQYADFAIITDDNPRGEDSALIIADILKGFQKPKLCKVLPNRKQAILYALQQADTADVVLVAGKGHEAVQIIGDKCLEFSDAKVVQEALC